MGLEIEIEYDDTPDAVWSPVHDAAPLREWSDRRRGGGSPPGNNPLIFHLGIALTALAVGAASTAGFLTGRTAVHDRAVALLHLAPVNPFVVEPLPAPPQDQSFAQLLATPWRDTADEDVSLAVINDGPDPITVLGATISSLDFAATTLTPADPAPIAPGNVSLLRGRAHFVCGDYAPDRMATIANLRARTADGVTRREALVVDRFSEIAEQAVCARLPTPQVVRPPTFSPPPPPLGHAGDGVFTAEVTASNRAPFPLRVSLPQAAVESWTGNAGLYLSVTDAVVIPPHGTGTIAITVKITDCQAAEIAATNNAAYDTLAFSNARDPVDDQQARVTDQAVQVDDLHEILASCLSGGVTEGGAGQ